MAGSCRTCRTGVFALSCFVGVAVLVALDHQLPSVATSEPQSVADSAADGQSGTVRVHVFNREGELVGPVRSPRWELSDQQWRERLTADEYRITRSHGTEAPFCGMLLDNHEMGVYWCVCCRLPLFSSDSKYHSGTGWPSFFQPIAPGNVREIRGFGGRNIGNEIRCARCDAHLGHVFNDGPEPTGHRFCLNSAALRFTPIDEAATLADPAVDPSAAGDATSRAQATSPAHPATAVFAGGCFWCTEAAFEQLRAVIDVESGYAGGSAQTANYAAVSQGNTAHAEAVRVTFDPAQVSYTQLLDVFFDAHDPTQRYAQGPDVGAQYRSAIFYADDQQKSAAAAKIRELTEALGLARLVHPITTKLESLDTFYPAEQGHQDYATRHPDDPYVQVYARPTACKICDKHAAIVKARPGIETTEARRK